MRRKKKICISYNCANPPFSGGLCEKHLKEKVAKEKRRGDALTALHTGIIDELPPHLSKELSKLRKWWSKACLSVQSRKDVEFLPYEEAEHALEWCIILAQDIIDSERTFRCRKAPESAFEFVRKDIWERFEFLEKGLRSNGLPMEK